MSTIQVKFGTSGHRGIIGQGFTLDHVQAIAKGIAEYLLENTPLTLSEAKSAPKVLIGYDPRTGNKRQFLEGSYTKCLLDSLYTFGIVCVITDDYSPTPLISWAVETYGYQGGIMLTASHNPPNYNGLKFNSSDGAPCSVSVATMIEKTANTYIQNQHPFPRLKSAQFETINLYHEFATALFNTCSALFPNQALKPLSIKLLGDCKHGATAKTWQAIFEVFGIEDGQLLHAEPLADFGMLSPNPSHHKGLAPLVDKIKTTQAKIGFANDPDGDRHVILDENAAILSPEEVAVIIVDYLITHGVDVLGIASTCASSHLIKRAAELLGCQHIETSVGFKYFAIPFKKARKQTKLLVAVESSGGFSISTHTLEKCGFLPVLLVAIIAQLSNTPISQLKKDIIKKFGQFHFIELSVKFPSQLKTQIISTLSELSIQSAETLFKQSVREIQKKDGTKITFETGSWALIRLSGTEAVARIYAESLDPSEAAEIAEIAKTLL